MFRQVLVAAFTVSLLGVSGTAHAILIPSGNTTVDTGTGLAWLDLTETEGLSPSAALAAHPGFRYALNTEVVTLFLNGGMTAVDATPRTADFAAATILVALLGNTFSPPNVIAQGFAEDSVSSGFFQNPFVQANNNTLEGRAFPGHCCFPNMAVGDVGVFLVAPAAVSEPATLFFFGVTAAGLGLATRWRQRRRNQKQA